MRKWTDEEIAMLKKKFPDLGTNIPELLSKFSRSAILIKAHRLGIHKKRRFITDKLIDEVYRRWRESEPLYKISKEIGFSDTALFRAIERKYGRDEACRLGKKSRIRGREKIRKVSFEHIDLENLREIFEKYRSSNLNIYEFTNKYKSLIRDKLGFYGPQNLMKAFRHFFPEEYSLIKENKFGHLYQRGRYWEYRVRDFFKNKGYFVWRSPASKGPADLIAIKKGEILLIQCKVSGSIKKEKREELKELAKSINAKALLVQRSGRKMVIRNVFEIKDRS